jgi:hypothetical protein
MTPWRACLLAAVLVSALAAPAAAAQQQTFASPEDAVSALNIALASDDVDALLAMFGAEHDDLVLGPDPASGRLLRQRAAAAVQEKTALRRDGDDKVTILLGKTGWPMPIPLRRVAGGWIFDTDAGMEEILLRRIGQDELAAIHSLKAVVQAQNDYAARSRRTEGSPQFARYVQSTPGRTDGLWWDERTAAASGPSPLAGFARAQQAFLQGRQPGDPFHGYYFRILTAQGPHAPGGAMSYVVDGRMTKGFAAIAWPAEYRVTGIMTFLVDRRGEVLEKDLGEDTGSLVQAMLAYDPDETWTPAEER